MHTLEHAKVGNIIVMLKKLCTHYALIIINENESRQTLRGIFITSQIRRQLQHRYLLRNHQNLIYFGTAKTAEKILIFHFFFASYALNF